MILRYFYDSKLAQASYLVGCAKTGEALVIDPAREIEPYLRSAQKEGLRITHVTETHIHADYVSGSRELAAATGAHVFLSDMGDAAWKYAWTHEPNVRLLCDGDTFDVGNIRLQAWHTPGHTPEHLAFLLTDTAASPRAMGIFSGDFVFVGDVGRPDLLEEAAGFANTKVAGARTQFASVARLKQMDDYLQVWPGHGAGSACGKALGAVPSTTVGYEKLANPALQFDHEQAFVDWLLDGQPEPPRYFAQMKKVNKAGPALLNTLAQPVWAEAARLPTLLAEGAQVFDLRSREEFAAGHAPGTLNIPATSEGYVTWVGWFVDYGRPLWLVLPGADALAGVLTDLRSIGVDDIAGVFAPEAAQVVGATLPVLSAAELENHLRRGQQPLLLDVRGRSEYDEEHARGVYNIPLGFLPRRLGEVPRDRPVVTLCASGYRSQIAASLLHAAGYTNAASLNADTQEWRALLPAAQ